ncbi:MAG: hypothetical protein RL341_2610 [Pseudomonadota bacterium]
MIASVAGQTAQAVRSHQTNAAQAAMSVAVCNLLPWNARDFSIIAFILIAVKSMNALGEWQKTPLKLKV